MKFVQVAGIWVNAYAVTWIAGNDIDEANGASVLHFVGGETLDVDLSADAVEALLIG